MRNSCLDVWECRRRHLEDCHTEWNAGAIDVQTSRSLELEGLSNEATVLYPEVKETLEELHRRGVRLFVASNGLEHYVKGIAEARGIMSLFEGVYSAGEHGTASRWIWLGAAG